MFSGKEQPKKIHAPQKQKVYVFKKKSHPHKKVFSKNKAVSSKEKSVAIMQKISSKEGAKEKPFVLDPVLEPILDKVLQEYKTVNSTDNFVGRRLSGKSLPLQFIFHLH